MESQLVARIRSTDPKAIMPPPGSHLELKPEEKDLLVRWIAGGGEYQGHWTFQTPVAPPVPAKEEAGENPIDRFVAERLAKERMEFSPQADLAALRAEFSRPVPEAQSAWKMAQREGLDKRGQNLRLFPLKCTSATAPNGNPDRIRLGDDGSVSLPGGDYSTYNVLCELPRDAGPISGLRVVFHGGKDNQIGYGSAKEPASTFEMYGPESRKPGTYAANCLLARRLAERGVRFIQLSHRGWDQHIAIAKQLSRAATSTGKPMTSAGTSPATPSTCAICTPPSSINSASITIAWSSPSADSTND